MRIDFDLNDIFCGEGEGDCSAEDVIRQNVIENVTSQIKAGLKEKVSEAVARTIQEEINVAVKEQMPSIVHDLLNLEFVPVDRYGTRGKPTTFRLELLREIQEQMQYKPMDYESKENIFTKAVRNIVFSEVKKFKDEFNRVVEGTYRTEVQEFILKTLSEKWGLVKK